MSTSLVVPGTIDGWKIGELLGKGGCGAVHVAERDGVKAALKVVHQRKIILKRKEKNNASMIAGESLMLGKIKHLQISYLPQMYQEFTVGPDGRTFMSLSSSHMVLCTMS